jgi:hypothetical protein
VKIQKKKPVSRDSVDGLRNRSDIFNGTSKSNLRKGKKFDGLRTRLIDIVKIVCGLGGGYDDSCCATAHVKKRKNRIRLH